MGISPSVLEKMYSDSMQELANLRANLGRATFVELAGSDPEDPDVRIQPQNPDDVAHNLAMTAIGLWNQHGFHPTSILLGNDPAHEKARNLIPGILGFAIRPIPCPDVGH